MASFPVWTRDDHERLKLALAQFPDGSPSFLDDIAKHLQKPVEEVTHYYNAFHVPKLHRLVRWTRDDHNRFESARKQFEGSPSLLDDIAKHLHKPLLEVKHYYEKINPDKDDLPHNPDQESDSEDDNVPVTETRKRQRTDQEDEDHRLDDNVLVTEASQRQRTQDQQHRLDDNVPVAGASKPPKNDGPWTPEEHGLFVEGFKKYGKGKGRLIAKEFVRTRTAAQVASHAQKYYQKLKLLESMKGKPDFGKKDPTDDDGSQGSRLGV